MPAAQGGQMPGGGGGGQQFGAHLAPRGAQRFGQGPGIPRGGMGPQPANMGGRIGGQPMPGEGMGAGPQQQQFGPQMAPRGPSQFAQPGTGSAGGQQQFGPQLAPRGPQQFGQQAPLGKPSPMPMPSPGGGGGDPRFAPRGPQQWMPQGSAKTGRIPGGQGKITGGGTGGQQQFGPQMAPRGPQQFAQPDPGYGLPGGPRDEQAGQGPMPAGTENRGGATKPKNRFGTLANNTYTEGI